MVTLMMPLKEIFDIYFISARGFQEIINVIVFLAFRPYTFSYHYLLK